MSGNYYKKSGKHAITTDITTDILNEDGYIKEEYLPNFQIGNNADLTDFINTINKIAEHIEKQRYHFTKEAMMNFVCETVLNERFCPLVDTNGERIITEVEGVL